MYYQVHSCEARLLLQYSLFEWMQDLIQKEKIKD